MMHMSYCSSEGKYKKWARQPKSSASSMPKQSFVLSPAPTDVEISDGRLIVLFSKKKINNMQKCKKKLLAKSIQLL